MHPLIYPIASLMAGILILLVPRLLNFIVAAYLALTCILGFPRTLVFIFPLVSIIAGILLFIFPKHLKFILAFYLILMSILGFLAI